ncbi:MAG TPA: TIGR01777 family oxidoreductase [Candidatus Acidoferrum sp.]|nr:TIGR01777 family oxidoreductase [Candidatus Acidoferrum sp.]
MKILMTGSTGLVGTALGQELQRAGHTVCRLVRPGTAVEKARDAGGFDVNWNPATGELGGAAVGADAVVNLAGASIADGRWTAGRKQLLLASRVDTTRALVRALSQMAARPRVLVSASGIGYYGSCGDQVLTEESPLGQDFLSHLGQEWEAEAAKAEALGIGVVRARFGIILARHGGALPRMVRPFLWGAGGKIGSGEQWMSWVTLQDVVAILRFASENGAVRGPVNVVSPQPVRNSEFTRVLAETLHRPTLFPAPAFALRLLLGEMAEELLLSSQRAMPAALEKLGYRFLHPDLATALAAILGTASHGQN